MDGDEAEETDTDDMWLRSNGSRRPASWSPPGRYQMQKMKLLR